MVKKVKTSSGKGKKSSKTVKVGKSIKLAKKAPAKKVTVKKAPVVVAPVVVAPVKVVKTKPVVVSEINAVNSLLLSLIEGSNKVITTQKQITSHVKLLNRLYKKEIKNIQKAASKARRNAKKDPNRPKRTPSGFAVPSKISSEMCDFLSLKHGTELSRTDITKKLTTYIREKNLQIPTNRRSFIPDNALGGILGPLKEIDQDKGYTYFNLQRYITPHIVSSSSSSATSSA